MSLARTRERVRKVIARYSSAPIDLLKIASVTPDGSDPYGDGEPAYEAPVALIGRGIRNPTPEQVTVIGNDEHFDIAFLVSYLEMEEKFPGVDQDDWVTTEDAAGFEGNLYNIERVHLSGKVEDYTLVILLGRTFEGRSLEGYPP